MKVKEKKEGVHIEIKEGNLKDLLDNLFDGTPEETEEDKKDCDLFEKIVDLFNELSIEGQESAVETLITQFRINLIYETQKHCCECKEEELKKQKERSKEECKEK